MSRLSRPKDAVNSVFPPVNYIKEGWTNQLASVEDDYFLFANGFRYYYTDPDRQFLWVTLCWNIAKKELRDDYTCEQFDRDHPPEPLESSDDEFGPDEDYAGSIVVVGRDDPSPVDKEKEKEKENPNEKPKEKEKEKPNEKSKDNPKEKEKEKPKETPKEKEKK